ncbi:iron-siderophore ABC transporter substrate-binding protein [Actinosynnema sp. NPDC020468]|uniref:ABC transporter substrate-binding protein n=1 Tax=Actinosynnema sp. NPDC020468 TaxID=3154488 RepID=UPI0033EB6BBB
MKVHLLVATAALLGLAACGTAEQPPESGTNQGGAFPRTISHAMGSTEVRSAPTRIAALDTSYVDAALALDLDVVAYTDYPATGTSFPAYLGDGAKAHTKDAKAVGKLAEPNLETLATTAPDLIVSAKVRHEPLYDKLSAIAPTVFSETTGATWKENIRLLARATGREELAEEKISAYEQRAAKVGDSIRSKVGHNPTFSLVRFVAGEQTVRLYTPNSFPGIVLSDVGLARPEGQPTSEKISANLSLEQIASVDAEKIFVATWDDGTGGSAKVRDQFRANPLWSLLKGAQQDVNDVVWLTSVSLQGAHGMLDDLAKSFGVDPAR